MQYGLGFPAGNGKENHGWRLSITTLVVLVLATVFVVLRFIARVHGSKVGWDDATIVLSWCFATLNAAFVFLAIVNGYGMHVYDLTPEQVSVGLRCFYLCQIFYTIVVTLNKIAAILLYLRIFITQKFRISAFITMGIIAAWSIGATATTVWQCVPIAGSWDAAVRAKAKCIDQQKFWVAYAIINVFTDLMVLVLPIPPILALHLGKRDKALILSVFLLGGFVTAASVLRATSVQSSVKRITDITWDFISPGMWTLIEANLGIISSCVIVLRQPLARAFPKIFGSIRKNSSNASPRNNQGNDDDDVNLCALPRQSSHPGLWREPAKNHRMISIRGPESKERTSDEEQFIDTSHEENGSETESQGATGEGKSGICKRVDVTWSEHITP